MPAAFQGRSAIPPQKSSRRAGEFDGIVGTRIRAVRTEAGFSLEELAARMGISVQQLYKYETGVNRISVSRLIDIADGLGVDIESLLRPKAQPAPRIGLYPHEIVKLVTFFCSITDPAAREKVTELAEFLAGFRQSAKTDTAGKTAEPFASK